MHHLECALQAALSQQLVHAHLCLGVHVAHHEFFSQAESAKAAICQATIVVLCLWMAS